MKPGTNGVRRLRLAGSKGARAAVLGVAGTAAAAAIVGLAVPASAAAGRYVALGDSYSSGTGAGSYGSSGSCKRSANSYPQLWANANGPSSFAFVACSGAVTSE